MLQTHDDSVWRLFGKQFGKQSPKQFGKQFGNYLKIIKEKCCVLKDYMRVYLCRRE
jgi:hypothetical protein